MLANADDSKQLCIVFIVPDNQSIIKLLRQVHQQGIIGIGKLVNYSTSNSNHIFSPLLTH